MPSETLGFLKGPTRKAQFRVNRCKMLKTQLVVTKTEGVSTDMCID